MAPISSLEETILSTPEEQAKLDRHVKNILSYKPILARIFKETVAECSAMSCDEIERCIEGSVDIDVIGLNPGTSNLQKINGCTQEDAVNGEGKITYDIRTYIRLPVEDEARSKILIDVEPQNDCSPGYDIIERAFYFCSRMTSAQLSTEFTNSSDDRKKYGNIKKVYSIWICPDVGENVANTIETYGTKRTVFPDRESKKSPRFDLFGAVIINLSRKRNATASCSPMIRMLTLLFNAEVSAVEKIAQLKEYGIESTPEFEMEVNEMTAYAASLLKEGTERGEKIGEKRGEKRGVEIGVEIGERRMQQKWYLSCLERGISREDAIVITQIKEKDIPEVRPLQ